MFDMAVRDVAKSVRKFDGRVVYSEMAKVRNRMRSMLASFSTQACG